MTLLRRLGIKRIRAGDVRYAHVVRLREVAEPEPERGTGTLNGLRLKLQGRLEGPSAPLRGALWRRVRAAEREIERHADLDRRRRHRYAPLRGGDQAAVAGVSAAQANVDRLRVNHIR
ncbi:MAG: hypothetical protein K2Z80_15160 [Xanthobacteraceae bacterium]|nr:hypothetical protein [Xanthobacteraceae bacterium]